MGRLVQFSSCDVSEASVVLIVSAVVTDFYRKSKCRFAHRQTDTPPMRRDQTFASPQT